MRLLRAAARCYLLLLVTVALAPISLYAQRPLRLSSIQIRGNRHEDATALVEAATQNIPIPHVFEHAAELQIAVQQIESNVNREYAVLGYYRVKIDSVELKTVIPGDSAKGLVLAFRVREGPCYVVRSITLGGAIAFDSASLLSRFDTKVGVALNEAILHQDILDVLKLYEQAGYPFARLDVQNIGTRETTDSTGLLSIALQLSEGHRAKVGKIAVAGNVVTASDVILRELRLPVGSYYDATAVERARSRVERLGFFETVSEPELYLMDDSTVALLIRVKEANTSTIDGVLGYVPAPNPTTSGYITGYGDLAFRNISGTGRDGSIYYDHEDLTSSQLEVKYLEPWLFHLPLNLNLDFLERQQDSTYTRTSYEADLSLVISEDISIVGSVALERVVPTVLPNQPFTVFDSRTITTGLGATFDTRDNAIAPRYGVLASLSASLGEKSIYGPAEFLSPGSPTSASLETLGIDASVYLPTINDRFIAAVGVHARNVSETGDTLDASDLLRLGGLRTIRGYAEGNFLVSRYAYTNLEFRAMTGKYSFLFVFSDIGYLFRDELKEDPSQLTIQPFSYGLGAQVESPLGILTVNVGVARGVPLDQAVLSFGIVKQF